VDADRAIEARRERSSEGFPRIAFSWKSAGVPSRGRMLSVSIDAVKMSSFPGTVLNPREMLAIVAANTLERQHNRISLRVIAKVDNGRRIPYPCSPARPCLRVSLALLRRRISVAMKPHPLASCGAEFLPPGGPPDQLPIRELAEDFD
jgi:hypothetical protein